MATLGLCAVDTVPTVVPAFQRLDLGPQQIASVPLIIHGNAGTTIISALVSCACLHTETPLPLTIGPSGTATIAFRVTGLRPGVEDIQIATTAGMARAQIQIAGPGTGRGIDVLNTALAEVASQHGTLLGVVHGLRGQIRHCQCSASGSLGAADRLAALPAHVRTLAPGLTVAWILSGDIDGQRPGVGAAMASSGWLAGDPRVAVTADPGPFLAAPGVVAVIPTAPVALQHRRLLCPVLDGGLAVELLVLNATGQIQAHHTMPVDGSLPEDAYFAARFPDRLTFTIAEQADPSASCLACHASAHQAWGTGPHAAAWTKLAGPDRTDTCVTCHTTVIGDRVLAPAVHCQACHPGSQAHVDSGGTSQTTGAADCRGCHDAQHDPGFQREAAWAKIRHLGETKPAP